MTFLRLLMRNLSFHWRGNFAVLLGVVVGCAVLTGALLVGDSLRGSLRDQTLARLGWVEQTLVAPHFFRQQLGNGVFDSLAGRIGTVLFLQTSAAKGESTLRGANLLGVDESFFDPGKMPLPLTTNQAVVNRAVAEQLHLKEGDEITVQFQKPEAVPQEAGLGKKNVELTSWTLKVGHILDPNEFGAAFSLSPQLQAPRNIFVPLKQLQEQLGVSGKVNVLLADGDLTKLNEAVARHLTLEDWGLKLRTPASRARAVIARYDNDHDGKLSYGEWLFTRLKGKNLPRYPWVIEDWVKPKSPRIRTEEDLTKAFERMSPYDSLESSELILSPLVVNAALRAAATLNAHAEPTMVYLCRFQDGAGGGQRAGVVAAMNPQPGGKKLADNEILLLDYDWPMKPPIGSSVVLRFKPPETHGPTTPDETATFKLAGFVEPKGPGADPSLTPDFPGITDQDDIGTWKLPFDDPDWSKNITREYGDRYWKQYRGTPKAYISLAAGRKLWGSRFGDTTSIRLSTKDKPLSRQGGIDVDGLEIILDKGEAGNFEKALLQELRPMDGGFEFVNARADALSASNGSTDFSGLFLGFSFFLIAAALLLVGLLFRLNLDRRASELGVLFAEGFRRLDVGKLLLGEGAVLSVIGSVLGLAVAVAYSFLLVSLLAYLWPGGALHSLLTPHVGPWSLSIGAGSTLIVSLLTIAWVVWSLARVPARALLAGQTTGEGAIADPRRGWSQWVALISLVLGLAGLPLGPFVPGGQEARAGAFFFSGALLLTAAIAAIAWWMRRGGGGEVGGAGVWNVARLGVRNAARHRARSLLTVGLLASAAFLIVAVESFRRQAETGNGDIHGPDGGCSLMAESDLPIFDDLKKANLADVEVYAFRVQGGDDASCLNLYKPQAPRVLGVPESLIQRGGFVFDSTRQDWLGVLDRPPMNGIPAIAEANTASWKLGAGVGDAVLVTDDRGRRWTLRLAALLKDSVFQSEVLISEKKFLEIYPESAGYRFFLLRVPPGNEDRIKTLLERAYADRGLTVTRSADRLAQFLAVENTYLTTFQALGGLGLLLGSLGLAVVLLRAVWERRAELALMRALGFRRLMLGWLILAENGTLLLLGLASGTAAALASVAPMLLSGEARVPWLNLLTLFGSVALVGLCSGTLAVVGTLRAPLLPALRRE
jgi:putative ABC transport system permease protein